VAEVLEFLRSAWKPCVEVGLFWAAYYVLLRFLKSTGGFQVLRGLVLVFVFFIVTQYLRLDTITYLLGQILPISVIAFLVVFQTELRRALTRIGQNPIFKLFLKEEKLVDEVVKFASAMAKKKIGALLAIEREISLKPYAESGILLDGVVSFELLSTIFMPNTPMHDGGVILQGSRVQSAGCLFPLSQNPRISKTFGTRHRAALGLTEETDAFVIVISEERGTISVAEKGELLPAIDSEELRRRLVALYLPHRDGARGWFSFMKGEKKYEPAQKV
jgi:diadenylate cyclase